MPLRSLVQWPRRADRARTGGRAPWRARWRLTTLLAVATGCRADPPSGTGGGDGGDEGTPLGTSSSSTGTTTYDAPTGCSAQQPCEVGYCVAPYDAAGGRGDAVCVPECVPADALDRWCFDDAGCCAELSCDPVDGLCRGPLLGSSSGDSWGASSSGAGATTEGSGTDTSSGSSTGA